MAQLDEDPSFFERERERLTTMITSDFEELLSSTNALNRKLEEVLAMTKEYPTIAALWGSFYKLMRSSGQEGEGGEEQGSAAISGAASTGKGGQ
ncbi:DASH complex subunit Dad1-domain-containing protein [Mycena galericulata]|nr:DASH complex subunit Dad1-domain-containing protein [Mycena galericulata]